MAHLPGDRLSEQYRRAQVANAAALARKIRRQFGGVLLDNPASQRNFLDVAVPEVIRHNRTAAEQASDYIRALRALEGGAFRGAVILAPPPSEEQVRTSLAVTGPSAYRRKVAKVQIPEDTARGQIERARKRDEATTGVMHSAIRHAQNGARDTVLEYVQNGKEARGYYRLTAGDDKVCYFCAMLASRINYNDDSFDESDALFEGIGTAKVHDGCRCHLRPIYSKAIPDSVIEYGRAWSALSGGEDDPVTNFRRGWETRHGVRKAA